MKKTILQFFISLISPAFLVSTFLLFGETTAYSQSAAKTSTNNSGGTLKKKAGKFHVKWKTNPFDNQVFIKNNSQFDGIIPGNPKVYYGINMGDIQAFFTANGVVFMMREYPQIRKGQDPDADGPPKPTLKYVYSEWRNTNATAPIGDTELSYYYTYPSGMKGTIKTSIYKNLTYHNLYPGIDVEYSFREGKPGIEYKLIVHPGADISLVRLLYSKGVSRSTINTGGSIETLTNLGIFITSSPKAFYAGDGAALKVSWSLQGNEQSFLVSNPDKNKKYIIDPWVTDPHFTMTDKAYDLDYDNYGNVYAFGGDCRSVYQFVKMNNSGVIQWTYNAVGVSYGFYGDFCTDKTTGTSYLVGGPGGYALKVNTNGTLIGTFTGNSQINELWRAKFDACNGDIVIGAGGTNGICQAGILDSNMSSVNPVNIMGAPGGYHDIPFLTIDPSGTQCYMASAYSTSGNPLFGDNMVMQLPLPSLSPTAYQVHEQLGFREIQSVSYVAGGLHVNGFNGAAASPGWLYLYNGDTLGRYNKNSGVLIGTFSIRTNSPFKFGGLDVDAYDNIFVGVADSIYVLDSTYSLQTKIPLQDTSFDVQLGQNGALYACGIGYVTQLTDSIIPKLITSISGHPTSCSLCNGIATVNVNYGIAPYYFTWSNGNTNQTDSTLCSGTSTVIVTDAACPPHTDTATITITAINPAPTVTTNITANELCNGNCIGAAVATATLGSSPYTYSWAPSGQTKARATGLCAGVYTITVTDTNGCAGTAIATITAPPAITATQAINNIVCNGGKASATINPTGGTSPYTFLWNPSGQSTATATGLGVGTYTVAITDKNGCTGTSSVLITQPTQLTTTMGRLTNVLCYGETGSAEVTAGGGTSPYTYTWSPSGQTTVTATGLTAGAYTITVTDHNACTGTTTITITQPTILFDTISSTRHAFCSLPNGNATVVARGGTSPYTYLWNPGGQTTTTANGLSIGTYTVTVTDYHGCTTSAIATITQPSAVTATISATTDISCYNGGNGTATVTAGGGTTPYTYLWTPGGNTNAHATGFFAVSYTVTVTDANGCTRTATTTLTEPPALAVTISEPKIICKDSTGILLGNATGGVSPYHYSWSSGATASTATITPIATRNYSITVTDANGCTASADITLEYGPPFSVVVAGKNSVCAGDSTTLCANATGAVYGASYLWEPENNTNACITVNPGIASVYTVSVIDGCGATATLSTSVYTDPTPVVYMSADFYQGCAPFCVQFRNGSTLSKGGIRQYVWTFGNGDTAQSKNPIYCYPSSGIYNVSLTVISDSGCSATLNKINMITVYQRPQAAFTYSPQPVTILTPTIQFTDQTRDIYGIVYRGWNFGDGTDSTSSSKDPSHTYQDTGTYCANLVVMNEHGCIDTTTNCLVIESAFTIYIPSAFTPNGDGMNDVFEPKGEYIKNFDMYIFDRWGMELYYTTDINKGWNGTVNGGSTISQEDIYVYKITVTDSQDNQHSYIGNVTLIK